MGILLAAFLGLALNGPNGLQVLHSPAAENSQQEMMLERLGSTEVAPRPSPSAQRREPAPPVEDRRAAAWRADHLTCASRKGRTGEQFQAECGAWAAEAAGAR